MSAPDFAAILRATLAARHNNTPKADTAAVLDAEVPELCQTCDGSGVETEDSMIVVGVPGGQYPIGPCPECPTIGQLLAIGALVYGYPWTVNDFGASAWPPIQGFLEMLRAVQP
jgi:hypothetical protein